MSLILNKSMQKYTFLEWIWGKDSDYDDIIGVKCTYRNQKRPHFAEYLLDDRQIKLLNYNSTDVHDNNKVKDYLFSNKPRISPLK